MKIMMISDEIKTEVARLTRKGYDAEQIAERMNERPFGEQFDVDVEQVREALEALAHEANNTTGKANRTTPRTSEI